jgi:hypothetical protein
MDQVSIKYTNFLQCKTQPKFTQIWIFGLKTNHLATLPRYMNMLAEHRNGYIGME